MCTMTDDELMKKKSESSKKIKFHFNDLILNEFA
jgi:hypothetical protein